MEIAVTIIFLGIYLIIWGSLYWTFAQEQRTQYGHPLMVQLTREQMEDTSVKGLLETYKRKINRCFLVLFLCGAVLFLPKAYFFRIFWSIFMIFPGLMIPSKIAAGARKKLLGIKADKGWKLQVENTRQIDLKQDRRNINKAMLSVYWFLLPAAFFAGTVYCAYGQENGEILLGLGIIGFLLMAAGFFFIRWLPNKTWCKNTEKNQKLNGWIKYTASLCWLELSAADAVLFFGIALFFKQESLLCLFLAVGLFWIAIICIFLQAKEYQRVKGQLMAAEQVYLYDEDDYWSFGPLGLRYSNPYDPQVLKENNSGGLNQTVNIAQHSAKWLTAGAWIFAVGIVLFVTWQFVYPAYLDHQGKLVDMRIEKEELIIESSLYAIKIPLETVQKAEICEDLGAGERTNGASTRNYGKGRFRYDRYGEVRVYAAWKHKPYLILHTKNGTYVVNDDDSQNTIAVYEEIKKEVSQ